LVGDRIPSFGDRIASGDQSFDIDRVLVRCGDRVLVGVKSLYMTKVWSVTGRYTARTGDQNLVD